MQTKVTWRTSTIFIKHEIKTMQFGKILREHEAKKWNKLYTSQTFIAQLYSIIPRLKKITKSPTATGNVQLAPDYVQISWMHRGSARLQAPNFPRGLRHNLPIFRSSRRHRQEACGRSPSAEQFPSVMSVAVVILRRCSQTDSSCASGSIKRRCLERFPHSVSQF